MPSWNRMVAPDVPELPVFCHAAVAGDTIYVPSGMLGVTDDFTAMVEGGVGAETRQAFRHAPPSRRSSRPRRDARPTS